MPCLPWFCWKKKKGNFSLPVTPTESEESTEKKRGGAKRHSKWCFWRKKNKTKSAAITESSSETPQETLQAVSLKLSGGCSPSLTRKTNKKTSTSQSVKVADTKHTEACLSTDSGRSDSAAVRTEKEENKIPTRSDKMREDIRKEISVLSEDVKELFLSYCMDEDIDLIDPEAFSFIITMLMENTSWLTPTPHKEKIKSPTTTPTIIPKTDKQLPDCGLPNLGMTCFVNASLQFLFTAETFCRELSDLLDNSTRGHEDTFLKSFVELSKLRNGSEVKWTDRYTSLRALISSASDINLEFTIDEQRDAHEFLCHCLNQMEESGRRLGWQEDVDPVRSHFMFKMRTSVTCSSCGTLQSDREEIFNHLSVSLTHDSLDQCLDDLINNPTELESKCKTCEGESASSRCTFSTLPRFLIVQLHRFKVTKNYKVVKLKTPVDINPELQINCDPESDTAGIENSTSEVRETDRNEVGGSTSTFRLISVISHIGDSVTCGHYVSDCLSNDPPQWMTCDDEQVTLSTEEKVLKKRSSSAYVLLFERVSTG